MIGIEGDTRPDRIPKAVWKCEVAPTDWLLIPTTTRGAARSITRMLQRIEAHHGPPEVSVCCQPVGMIVERILRLRPRATAATFDQVFRPIAQHYRQPTTSFASKANGDQPKQGA
jgi:hypothetical protein